ncbi:MAG: MFS transporter [Atopobiaceae bacterium]
MKSYAKTKAGIFSLTLLSMAALGITPSLGLIMADFPEAGASTVQMLVSLPSLTAIAAALIVARTANHMSKKTLSLLGAALVAAGGLLPFAIPAGIGFMLVCSAVLGLGVGFITNLTQLLFTEFLPPEERQSAMAQNTCFVNIGAIFMTMVGGQLSVGGWRNNYLVYLIALAVLAAAAILIPRDEPKEEAAKAADVAAGKGSMAKASYVVLVLGILFQIAYNAFPNNIAMYLSDTGLGDSAVAGLMSSVMLAGGLVAGAVLGKILPYFQKSSFAVAFAMVGISLLGLAVLPNLGTAYVFSFLAGASLSVFFSQAPFVLSVINPPAMIARAIAFYSIGTSLGGFLSPVVLNALSGGNAATTFLVAGILALAVCIVLAATRFQGKALGESAQHAGDTMEAARN